MKIAAEDLFPEIELGQTIGARASEMLKLVFLFLVSIAWLGLLLVQLGVI